VDEVIGKGAYKLCMLDGGLIPGTWIVASLISIIVKIF